MKCDQDTPCSHCLRRGEAESCAYEQEKIKHNNDQSIAAELARVKARLEKVEAKSVKQDHPVEPTKAKDQVVGRQSSSSTHDGNTEKAKEWENWSMFQRMAQKPSPLNVVGAQSTRSGYSNRKGNSTLSLSANPSNAGIHSFLSILPSRSEALQLIEDK